MRESDASAGWDSGDDDDVKAALGYISEMAGEMRDIAEGAGEPFLAYLLEMAREEARSKLSPPPAELVEDRAATRDGRGDG